MDKFKSYFRINKKIMYFLFCFFIVSIVFGSILPFFLNESDKLIVSNYLKDFVSNIRDYDCVSLMVNCFCNNFGFLIIIFILGISIIGAFLVMFLFFLKGFVLGFSVSCIIINYGFKGILFGFVYLFPHQILNMILYGILTSYSISFSLKFVLFLMKKYDFNIRFAFKRFFKTFCICSLLMILCVIYESLLLPKLFLFIFNLLGL